MGKQWNSNTKKNPWKQEQPTKAEFRNPECEKVLLGKPELMQSYHLQLELHQEHDFQLLH